MAKNQKEIKEINEFRVSTSARKTNTTSINEAVLKDNMHRSRREEPANLQSRREEPANLQGFT